MEKGPKLNQEKTQHQQNVDSYEKALGRKITGREDWALTTRLNSAVNTQDDINDAFAIIDKMLKEAKEKGVNNPDTGRPFEN